MHIPLRDLPPELQKKISQCLQTDFVAAKLMRDNYEHKCLKNAKPLLESETSQFVPNTNRDSHLISLA